MALSKASSGIYIIPSLILEGILLSSNNSVALLLFFSPHSIYSPVYSFWQADKVVKRMRQSTDTMIFFKTFPPSYIMIVHLGVIFSPISPY